MISTKKLLLKIKEIETIIELNIGKELSKDNS